MRTASPTILPADTDLEPILEQSRRSMAAYRHQRLVKIEQAHVRLNELEELAGPSEATARLREKLNYLAGDELPKARKKRERLFWAKVTRTTDGCWIYTHTRPTKGGRPPILHWRHRQMTPRRIAFEILRPERDWFGADIRFTPLCAAKDLGRYCINPQHFIIRDVTNPAAARRGRPRLIKEAGATLDASPRPDLQRRYCPRGHPLPLDSNNCADCAQDRKRKRIELEALTLRMAALQKEER